MAVHTTILITLLPSPLLLSITVVFCPELARIRRTWILQTQRYFDIAFCLHFWLDTGSLHCYHYCHHHVTILCVNICQLFLIRVTE